MVPVMMLLGVRMLEFGERRQFAEHLARGTLLHVANGEMHPAEGDGDDEEEQHKATRPNVGEVRHHTERKRQDEAAEPTDHADQSADRTNVFAVIVGDVFVDRRLAERHEEAENEDREHEWDEAHLGREGDRAADAVDHIVGVRVGEHQQADQRDAKGPVHDQPRAVAVRQMPAIGAEYARRNRIGHGEHAGRFNIESVDADHVARQPQSKRDEATKHEEVIQ